MKCCFDCMSGFQESFKINTMLFLDQVPWEIIIARYRAYHAGLLKFLTKK